MKYLTRIFSLVLASVSASFGAVNIGHVEPSAAIGQFLASDGNALAGGGVTIGYFSSPVADSAFDSVTTFAELLNLGGANNFKDVRTLGGTGTPDWDFAGGLSGGTVSGIPIANLPQNTQLYIIAFNAGTYVNGFAGSTEWAVVRDTAHLSPADNVTKSLLLNTVAGAELIKGTDNSLSDASIRLTSISAVPEPSRAFLGMIGLVALFVRRRR